MRETRDNVRGEQHQKSGGGNLMRMKKERDSNLACKGLWVDL